MHVNAKGYEMQFTSLANFTTYVYGGEGIDIIVV
jgi:hypothetical protein